MAPAVSADIAPAAERRHPLQRAALPWGELCWREAGAGPALVLLHGIGSGALSWAAQLDGFKASHRVIAWDAPGYGESAPLPMQQPLATHYAGCLQALLLHLGITDLMLVGHSLGALVAAAWAAGKATAAAPQTAPDIAPAMRLRGLVLASPARGYGSSAPAERQATFNQRVALIERLGPAGLAAERAAGLCAPGAAADVRKLVRWNMARVTRGGYAQAAHMLAHDDLAGHLRKLRDAVTPSGLPISVLCGDLDRVTPLAACVALAAEVQAPVHTLRGVAHACYVEDPAQFNAALRQALERCTPQWPQHV